MLRCGATLAALFGPFAMLHYRQPHLQGCLYLIATEMVYRTAGAMVWFQNGGREDFIKFA
jgi:hypothetical protein